MRFDGNGLSAGVNDPLRAGTYRLVAGIVQVTFARGAEVMITAPAEFALQSEERLYLKRGKLTAKVSERAKGFTVETPSATLVDLGTEFAADVDRDGNGEVHVFRGEVIVQPRSLTDSRPLRLTEAQATRIDAASATPSGIEVDSTRFLRQLEEPKTSYSRLTSELGPRGLSPHGTFGRWALDDRLHVPRADAARLCSVQAAMARPGSQAVSGPRCASRSEFR